MKVSSTKVSPHVLLLFNDRDGLGGALFSSLRPDPHGSTRRLDENVELSLKHYGVKNTKAYAKIIHFIDGQDSYKATVLLVDVCEAPILACALNEILSTMMRNAGEQEITFILPCIHRGNKGSKNTAHSIYGRQISGGRTGIMESFICRCESLDSTMKIGNEPLACLLQIITSLNLPSYLLIGQSSEDHLGEEKEGADLLFINMGCLLASVLGLTFNRNSKWNPTRVSKQLDQPWCSLYA